MRIVTLPLQQYPVGRQFNRRVYAALQSHGIWIGMPQEIERTGLLTAGTLAPMPAALPYGRSTSTAADTP